MRKAVIAGGSGFVGEAVAAAFLEAGYGVVVVDRVAPPYPSVAHVPGNLVESVPVDPVLFSPDVVVNLVGAPIFQKWDEAARREILESRTLSTRNLVASFANERVRPKVLVQASAVGYYGSGGEAHLNESSPRGDGFLAEVCEAWEAEAKAAEAFGVRVVVVRQATVLGPGGYLAALAPAARWGFAGRMGSGRQLLPWIHRDDLAALYRAVAEDPSASGPVNAAAPSDVRQAEFAAALGRALRAPWELPVPISLLRLRFGGLVDELVLASQRVESKRLPAGFGFRFAELGAALDDATAALRAR